ncbi:sugar phosphate isomerase/epimerase [Lachnospiraceae bacterium KGMB03038]|nr:sugar phosphate isomerase/epimerase [Lachnospiraceae bacterium KGMB03038]
MLTAINGATTMPYSLEEDIHFAAKVGFDGVEIWWDKLKAYLKDHTAESLAEEMERCGIIPVGVCPFLVSAFRDTEKLREEFKSALDAADRIQCRLLTICPDFRPAWMSVEEGLKRQAEEFSWYAKKAEEKGIRLAIEPIGGHTLVPGPTEALRLIDLAGSPPNLGIVLDTFHYMRSGITQNEILSIPAEKLYIVHINDSERGMAEELQDKNRLYPFEGCIDLNLSRNLLDKIGYCGYCSVEVFRPEYWEQSSEDIHERAFESAKKFVEKK